ncbi:MAG: hypothetical protein AAF993_01270 [Pseudomonadota bacterium]
MTVEGTLEGTLAGTVEWLSSPPPVDAPVDHPAPRDFTLQGQVRRITGALWLPAKYAADTPMVLLGHGASGDRYQAPIPHLCKRLVSESGFVCLALDGPVHGLRQVGPGGRVAFAEEMQRDGWIDDMVTDWHDAFHALTADGSLGQGPLGYFGLSMGTLFGVPLLASKLASKLASELTFSAAVIGLCGVSGAAQSVGQRLAQDAGHINCPLLFLMQLEDELFPRDGYLALFDALAAEDKRLHANPGLHPEVPAEEVAASCHFLQRYLTGTVERRIVNPLAE